MPPRGGCDVDIPPRRGRGAAAATTWIFRGHESRRRRGNDVNIPRTRVAAPPRLRRGYSADGGLAAAAAATWIFRRRGRGDAAAATSIAAETSRDVGSIAEARRRYLGALLSGKSKKTALAAAYGVIFLHTLRVIVFDISINESLSILGVNERKVIFEIVTAAALTLCALQ